ncbi:MAG: ATP-binding protein [Candidatus Omnitrophica bacterium]|nr:ATP-binding protein [Candidatus Omnitrophota bacterium]
MEKKVDYIVVEASYGGLELISSFIQKKCMLKNVGFKKTWEIMLTVDEICSGIVNCGINEPNIIKVSWQDIDDNIKIEIIDDGTPFNPLSYESENSDYGIGLHLINEMVDFFDYKRENGLNIITLIYKNRKKYRK